MSLVVLLGGARSGKSTIAVELAGDSGTAVTFVATGEARDDEMRARIESHRSSRPPAWTTVEEPVDLARAVREVDPAATLLVDCLSLWVANLLERGESEQEIERDAASVAAVAARRPGRTIAVSNEVGLGVVPATPLGRVYRDVLGRVNAAWVSAAGEAFLIVAGRAVRLEAVAS
jgi:adenosyl cobinamide kinase/adenosyl cobinamide phosphate guanylyltransferase